VERGLRAARAVQYKIVSDFSDHSPGWQQFSGHATLLGMGDSYYSLGHDRARSVQKLFGKIAPRYDFINDLQSLMLHRAWKRKLVRLTGAHKGESSLDICCGTGDVALALSCAGVKAVGVDFSRPMLEVAQERSRKTSGAHWVQGDALNLPFAPEVFDVVTMAYGLRNLADFQAGLGEASRVLKPGGRLLLLDFGKPGNRLLRASYFAYLKVFVPLLGWAVCRDSAAYAYILESLRRYPGQSEIAGLLRDSGLDKVRVCDLLGGIMSIHAAQKPVPPR
jgi:demethylmenaquinone methyltransferase / 2-methoxy-6-polyprenyl-1,4-benzoquinol methylase